MGLLYNLLNMFRGVGRRKTRDRKIPGLSEAADAKSDNAEFVKIQKKYKSVLTVGLIFDFLARIALTLGLIGVFIGLLFGLFTGGLMNLGVVIVCGAILIGLYILIKILLIPVNILQKRRREALINAHQQLA
ncbi:MAG: hypothetical protein LBM01_02205 [Christensenellaceae bacterium]|jgi:hypothetical protein|nr:hypothetical protein [Christensenellaceae bacterium]